MPDPQDYFADGEGEALPVPPDHADEFEDESPESEDSDG